MLISRHLGYISRSEMARSYGRSFFFFLFSYSWGVYQLLCNPGNINMYKPSTHKPAFIHTSHIYLWGRHHFLQWMCLLINNRLVFLLGVTDEWKSLWANKFSKSIPCYIFKALIINSFFIQQVVTWWKKLSVH